MSLKTLFKNLSNTSFKSLSNTSAFSRLAGADLRLQEAQGKVSAIKDSIKTKKSQVADLKAEAEAIHADHDGLDLAICELHDLLG